MTIDPEQAAITTVGQLAFLMGLHSDNDEDMKRIIWGSIQIFEQVRDEVEAAPDGEERLRVAGEAFERAAVIWNPFNDSGVN